VHFRGWRNMTVYVLSPELVLPEGPDSGFRDPARFVQAELVLQDGTSFYGTNWLTTKRLRSPGVPRSIVRNAAVHAERDVILQALDECDVGELVGAVMNVTLEPCAACRALIEAVGITAVFYRETYVPSDAGVAQ